MSMTEIDRTLLGRAVELAGEARASGNHPFGALLADEDGTVLLEARNSSGSTRGLHGTRGDEPGPTRVDGPAAGNPRANKPVF